VLYDGARWGGEKTKKTKLRSNSVKLEKTTRKKKKKNSDKKNSQGGRKSSKRPNGKKRFESENSNGQSYTTASSIGKERAKGLARTGWIDKRRAVNPAVVKERGNEQDGGGRGTYAWFG